MAEWCASMTNKLRSSAQRPDNELPELNQQVGSFPYHFGDISAWHGLTTWCTCTVEAPVRPKTCTWAAWPLCAAWTRRIQRSQHCGQYVCSGMQSIRGQPGHGWEMFLSRMSIEHVLLDLDDPRTKLPGEDAFCEEMADV
jgi:hypothetical protein